MRREERHARKIREAEERAARRVQRIEERARRVRFGRAPFFVRLAVPLVLFAVQLALTLTLRVVVPMVLTILSLFFGRGLLRAASRVSEAGDRAVAAVGRARDVVSGNESSEEPRIRVAQGEPQEKVRVAEARGEEEEESEEKSEEKSEARRRAK